MSETQTAPQVTGKMFLFERPELLNPTQHGDLGIHQSKRPFNFCATARAVPLTISELATAMRYYPVVFSSDATPIPLAILGLLDEINLFVNDEGMWDQETYIPGYIRRYPFAVAAETGTDRFAIVIDVGFDGVRKQAELPLFQNGEPTENTKAAIEFCRQYEADRRATEVVMKSLEGFGLIAQQTATYSFPGGGEPKAFAQYWGIDEQRLNEMPDEQFLALRKSGLLPVIYGQLMSLGNWRALLARRSTRHGLAGESMLEPLKRS